MNTKNDLIRRIRTTTTNLHDSQGRFLQSRRGSISGQKISGSFLHRIQCNDGTGSNVSYNWNKG